MPALLRHGPWFQWLFDGAAIHPTHGGFRPCPVAGWRYRSTQAGVRGLKDFGGGTASVRFICGTFSPHETLERTIAEFFGFESSYTFVSCWNANEAVFPTLCEPGDIIISDELNHASLIDSIRLATVIKKGLLKDITTLIAQEDANVTGIQSDNVRGSGQVVLRLRLRVADYGQLSTLLGKLDALPGVEEARRSG